MRFAFVSTMEGDPWGGSEELWSQTALRLLGRGHRVYANTKRWPAIPTRIHSLIEAGCNVTRRPAPNYFRRAVRRYWGDPAFRWLDRIDDSLVVLSQGSQLDGVAWGEQCLARGVPYIMVVQAGVDWAWPCDEEMEVVRRVYLGATASVFVSESNLRLVTRQIGAHLDNAIVMRNPFNVPYSTTLEWPRLDEPLRLACVARLHAQSKGQDILLEVLASTKWKERAVSLSLFGSGPNEGSLRRLARFHGVQNVEFAGFAKDVCSIWREHHLLVLPSRIEGLPLALVEAALCGRPAVVTGVAGNPELVEDRLNGFICAAPSIDLLDGALERAWEKRAFLKQMGAEAARRVRLSVPADPVGSFVAWLTSIAGAPASNAFADGRGCREARHGNADGATEIG